MEPQLTINRVDLLEGNVLVTFSDRTLAAFSANELISLNKDRVPDDEGDTKGAHRVSS
jgi:hypothetical protein